MGTRLVIVESPAKARTIAGFLGEDYTVRPSVGHIRDLPERGSQVEGDKKRWDVLGVDVDNDFRPHYIIPADRKGQVADLKKLLRDAEELYLATDEDREGEAISWHLLEALAPPARIPVRRMVFHEITPQAIQHAIDHPREIDRQLVDAQEARRILDRIYGFKMSEVVWRKMSPARSAGRVQSVAVRIVVDRERERIAFVTAAYWDVDATFRTGGAQGREFGARLVAVDDRRVATGKDFTADGAAARADVVVLDEATVRSIVEGLDGREVEVTDVEARPYRRSPAAPFMTSTLQQEAGRKLGLTSGQAMRAAQELYDKGFITYMRTDSTSLSETAIAAARGEIGRRYGREFLPDAPRTYAKKVKNAQETHEAIRPAGETFRSPDEVRREFGERSLPARLYELIWQRTIASQMNDAVGESVTARLGATTASGRKVGFSTSGTVITHAGFRRVYVETVDDADDGDDEDRQLPSLAQGDRADVVELLPRGHETQPPSRYTEASLVKRLEELGIGRPSTYASIMSTIQDRGYVWRKGTALVPTLMAFAVVQMLERHFADLVDYEFTARMEDDLDGIASGETAMVPWLRRFYLGADDAPGLRTAITEHLDEIDPRAVSTVPLGADADGVPVVARFGKYGPYVERGEDRATIPDDLPPDELTVERALELIAAPGDNRDLGVDPESGLTVAVRNGRFGPYVQLGDDPPPSAGRGSKKVAKPARASLFKDMDIATVTLEDALDLLRLPRTVGIAPDGEAVVAANGRFGPFLSKGTENRSLETERQLLTIGLEEALEILARPKERRRGVTKPPLAELGPDPVSGRPLVVKEGRFGAYVTDGETNASLRTGDRPEELTVERAVELLDERRARIVAGGGTKAKKPAAKKPAAKKPAAKKPAAKKPAAKKPATKKPAARKRPTS